MIQKISAPISVNLVFDHKQRLVFPKEVIWEGRTYPILKIGLHHTYRAGFWIFTGRISVSQELLLARLPCPGHWKHPANWRRF